MFKLFFENPKCQSYDTRNNYDVDCMWTKWDLGTLSTVEVGGVTFPISEQGLRDLNIKHLID